MPIQVLVFSYTLNCERTTASSQIINTGFELIFENTLKRFKKCKLANDVFGNCVAYILIFFLWFFRVHY